ncbi:TolB family protein [Streptomyces silvensis]|uniref:S9 family peptidase n=1 Tax=Streptomyces silvensis TaxID=1765722 RepID=A0A0W7X243_9ACTN|nr:PD40 domain-containing protein [Streptomyces silvensis]KUF16826.1 hypothetical protein AT728_23225 [Streptomyces silvensis]
MAGAKRKKRRGRATRTVGGGALAVLLTAAALPAAVATPADGSRGPALGSTEVVSVAADGSPANGRSYFPVVSADGEVVAFRSDATNLVPGDTNDKHDLFVRDLRHRTTQRIVPAPEYAISDWALSADGRYLAYSQYRGRKNSQVIVRDLRTGRTERADVGLDAQDMNAESPVLSADGRTVAFLANDKESNVQVSAYVRDLRARRTERVSFPHAPGVTLPRLAQPSLSADGTKVAYELDSFDPTHDKDDFSDVYVHDRVTGRTTQADTTHDGRPANRPAFNALLSTDGSTVAFDSQASNMVPGEDPEDTADPFVRDLRTGKLTRIDEIPPGPDHILYARALSGDGSKLLVQTYAHRDVYALYLRDVRSGVDVLVSPDKDGKPASAAQARMDARAQKVVFVGDDSFVPDDANHQRDVLVHTVR